nr:A.superbus venom factor 2-like [Equus caballus]
MRAYKVAIRFLHKSHWPVNDSDKNSLYTIEATAYALMQKLDLGRHNETYAIIKWLLEKRELGGGFQSTQATAVAVEALTRFSQAVPFEGVQDLRVQISAPKTAFSVEWLIDQNSAYQQRSAKILTMCHRSPESWEHTCNLFHLNVTLQNAPEVNKKGEETLRLRMETRSQDGGLHHGKHTP